MAINGYTNHAGLQALLEFESTHLGIPLKVRHGNLTWDAAGTRDMIEVLVHDGGKPVDFGLFLDGTVHRLSAPLWLPPDDAPSFGPLDDHDNVQPLVSMIGHNVMIHIPPRILDGLALRVLGPALEQALPLAMEAYEKQILVRENDRYVILKETAWSERLGQRRREVQEAERSVMRLEEDLRHRYRLLVESREMLKQLESQVLPAIRRSARAEIVRLRGMCPAALQSAGLDGERLVLETNPITIEHDDFIYQLGRYSIAIDLRSHVIRIHALDGTVGGYQHPHVSGGGEPCLGSIAGPIASMLAEGDLFCVVVALLEYLSSYNPESPHQRIERWDPNWSDDDRWDSCYEDVGPRDCVTCDETDCPHHDGAADRCWELLDGYTACIECRDCDWASVAQDRCRDDHNPQECISCTTEMCAYASDADACHEAHGGEDCDGCEHDTCRHWAAANQEEEEE
jgi:hypothetical protein